MKQKVPYYVREIRKGQQAEEQDNRQRAPRVMIAAAGNARGADQAALALLGIWREQEQSPAAFAAGPLQNHLQALRLASGNDAHTLDSWFHEADTLSYLLSHYTEGHRVALIEARAQYFDTCSPLMLSWSDGEDREIPRGSAAELARLTRTPVILVVDVSDLSFTRLAYLKGLLTFRPNEAIAGFILAGLPETAAKESKRQVETELGLPVFGTIPESVLHDELPRLADLVPEVYEDLISRKITQLVRDLRHSLDVTAILQLADSAPQLDADLPQSLFRAQRFLGFEKRRYRLGVARDEAFCSYYQENLDLLGEMGADLVFFSPLRDPFLPPDLDGLYFGSGRLLDYLADASQNETVRQQIHRLSDQGLPIMAEDSGTVYLAKAFRADSGREWPLVGILPTVASLSALAVPKYYANMTSRRDDLLAEHGMQLPCLLGSQYIFSPDGASYRTAVRGKGFVMEGFSTPTIWGSQAQIHFYGQPLAAARFTQACMKNLVGRSGGGEALQGWKL